LEERRIPLEIRLGRAQQKRARLHGGDGRGRERAQVGM
jgi:hypothetical protein